MSTRECERVCFACPAVCLRVWVWASVCEGWRTCDLHVSGHVCAWPGEVRSGREPGLPGSPLLLSPVPPPPSGCAEHESPPPCPRDPCHQAQDRNTASTEGPLSPCPSPSASPLAVTRATGSG